MRRMKAATQLLAATSLCSCARPSVCAATLRNAVRFYGACAPALMAEFYLCFAQIRLDMVARSPDVR